MFFGVILWQLDIHFGLPWGLDRFTALRWPLVFLLWLSALYQLGGSLIKWKKFVFAYLHVYVRYIHVISSSRYHISHVDGCKSERDCAQMKILFIRPCSS